MRTRATVPALALTLLLHASALLAAQAPQQRDSSKAVPDSAKKVAKLAPIAVTATRAERQVFRTPTPLLVTDAQTVREESPNGVQDLFRNLPGVDVVGVGPNQGRLQIRGQRGQRILLLENGTRLNNSRRQQDFGELPALTDVNGVSRVEIIRGPASVLYGTDAIGGVVNQITRRTPSAGIQGVNGWAEYRFGSADNQSLVNGRLESRSGKFSWSLGGGWREAADYTAPAGSYGNLTLADPARVYDTGVTDWNLNGEVGWDIAAHRSLSLRVSRYDAADAGFGYVDSKLLGDPSGTLVRILYPSQQVTRTTLDYTANQLSWGLADRFTLTAWGSWNKRTLDFNVVSPFGAPFPPDANVNVFTSNYTDIASYGARLEAAKILGGRHSMTYGFDFFLGPPGCPGREHTANPQCAVQQRRSLRADRPGPLFPVHAWARGPGPVHQLEDPDHPGPRHPDPDLRQGQRPGWIGQRQLPGHPAPEPGRHRRAGLPCSEPGGEVLPGRHAGGERVPGAQPGPGA
jgi:outer membrane receptor protein involved in Fe transport